MQNISKLSIFYLKLFFLEDLNLVEKKASKLLKQILRSILILPQGYFAIEVANCYETDFYIFFSV